MSGQPLYIPPFHELDEPADFYFVRHGESESNAGGRIQGHTDSPLSDLGRMHAQAAGRWFADRRVDVVLTSPLSRACETAREIARCCGCSDPQPLDELIELDTGRYSGLSLDELHDFDPQLHRRFRVYSWEAVPEAERIDSLRNRAHRTWMHLLDLAKHGRRRVVSVSHGGTIQWLIKATVGSDDQRWMPIFRASNCGIFLFRAESTLAPDERRTTTPEPGTGFYGIWNLVNHVPY